MKKIVFVVFAMFAALLLSCSHSDDHVKPASQKSLGLVIPRPSSELSSNLILLKDGRTADPVSGIASFDTIPVGDKLLLTFTEGATHNGVLEIHVTQFASAQDSSFNPVPSIPDTATFTGIYSGVAFMIASDSSFHNAGTTSIHFTSPNKFSCPGVEGGYPSPGAGTFSVSGGTITFTDATTNSNTVLNGSFDYVLNSSGLYMWSDRDGIHYGYSLRRN